MKFCSECGSAEMAFRMPDGDTHARWVCGGCGVVHYENPNVIVGCVVGYQRKILMVRRATEPRLGTWTLPSGFMENGETLEEASAREVLEEAGVRVVVEQLYSVFSIPEINQVYVLFHALADSDLAEPGPECSAARYFRPDEVPWAEVAYDAITAVVRRYLTESAGGCHGLYVGAADQGRVYFASGNSRP